MKKSIVCIASIAFTIGTFVSGCSIQPENTTPNYYNRVCVNAKTHRRVPGVQCGVNDRTASNGYLWWYLTYGTLLPAYNTRIVQGSSRVSRSAIVEHDESLLPRGGKISTTQAKRSFTTGSGKKVPPSKVNAQPKPQMQPKPQPQSKPNYNAPKPPVVKAPAPVYRPPASKVGK